MWRAKVRVQKIQERLRKEGIKVTRRSLYLLIKKYKETGSYVDRPRAPRKRQLTEEHYSFINQAVATNTTITSWELHGLVTAKFPSLAVSRTPVKKACKELGWNAKKTRYCALITDVNKENRVTWCLDRLIDEDMDIDDVVWTDKSSVQLEPQRKITRSKASKSS